jgi:hypothetical protein
MRFHIFVSQVLYSRMPSMTILGPRVSGLVIDFDAPPEQRGEGGFGRHVGGDAGGLVGPVNAGGIASGKLLLG